jgi:hypothetical protein
MSMRVDAQTQWKAESDSVRKQFAGKLREGDEAAAQDKQAAGGNTRLRKREQQVHTRISLAH